MADITSIAPYEAVTVNDTTDETRTDLPALIQRMENQIALQNQVIRQFLEHLDSISLFSHSSSVDSVRFADSPGENESHKPAIQFIYSDGSASWKWL